MTNAIYTTNEISCMIKDIFEENNVSRAFLFGSYAKGTQTEKSDVDIFAEFTEKLTLFDICGILYDLRERLNKNVDFFDVNELALNPELLKEAKSNGVCIYER